MISVLQNYLFAHLSRQLLKRVHASQSITAFIKSAILPLCCGKIKLIRSIKTSIQRPSKEKTEERKATWTRYKDLIEPNRKTGLALLEYLQSNYSLTEILDADVLDTICCNVTMNQNFSEKLPVGTVPVPKAFYPGKFRKGRKVLPLRESR